MEWDQLLFHLSHRRHHYPVHCLLPLEVRLIQEDVEEEEEEDRHLPRWVLRARGRVGGGGWRAAEEEEAEEAEEAEEEE